MTLVPNRQSDIKVTVRPQFTPARIKARIGWPQAPPFVLPSPVMKGKQSVRNVPAHVDVPTDPDKGTDDIPGRYTIFDLEGIDNSLPVRRYTVAELAQRLLVLAIFEANSGVPSTICIDCLRMVVGERPCPHDCFPEDPRKRPKLVWPDEEHAGARGGTVSPVGSPVQAAAGSSQEYWRLSPGSDFFSENRSLLATPPGPSHSQSRAHAAASPHPGGHRSGSAAPASPAPNPGTTVNWFPCPFSHRHSTAQSAAKCDSRAMLRTYEHPPPTAVPTSVERSLQIAMAMSSEPREDDEDTWSTISRTRSSASASASTARPPANRTSAPSSASATRSGRAHGESRANTAIRTGAAGAATSRASTRAVQHQPVEEEEEEGEGDDPFLSVPAEHPLVPIPPGANPIPFERIYIANDNPARNLYYVVTTGSTVGVFDNLTLAQHAAQVSRGSWHKASSYKEALSDFRNAVAQNIVVVRP